MRLPRFGVGEWLRCKIAATEGVNSAKLDKPQFNSDITIKFSASGGYSFAFPAGWQGADALFGSLRPSYEQLNIAMTAVTMTTTKTVTAVTSPASARHFAGVKIQQYKTSTVTTTAQSQMDLLQIQQAITKHNTPALVRIARRRDLSYTSCCLLRPQRIRRPLRERNKQGYKDVTAAQHRTLQKRHPDTGIPHSLTPARLPPRR